MLLCQHAISLGARFVVLPEMMHSRGAHHDGYPLPGRALIPFMQLASEHRIWICAGSVIEPAPISGKRYNTSVMISPQGTLDYVYRKIHLFDAVVSGTSMTESDRYAPGDTPVLATIFDSIRVGMSVCYDLRFGDLYQHYATLGAHILLVPSSFTATTGDAHWHVLCRARAIEHHCFVLAPNQVGVGANGVDTFGHSLIVDPWGTVLAEGSATEPDVLVADLDMTWLQTVRSRFNKT